MTVDTIAAVATAPGVGGVAVVRVSGPEAEQIGTKVFKPRRLVSRLRSHTLHAGDVVSPLSGEVIDEVLAVIMRRPRSYTGEDVLEIHCHGGWVTPRRVLEAVLAAGARPAKPGEFTKRAFLNGRLDLSQAEAVADLITAETEKAAEMALAQLRGRIGERIEASVENLRDILACLESSIDFSEEDGVSPEGDLADRLQEEVQGLNALCSTYGKGRLYRQGARVVIVGRTNVGKSSLLNRLLGERRAIVTPVPGTTRDFIEEVIDLNGLPVRLTDTAGIRETVDRIEKAGIDLVWEKVREADGVIALFDGSEGLSDDDRHIVSHLAGKKILYVINKSDLPPAIENDEITALGAVGPPLRVSAKFGEGMENLKDALFELLTVSGPSIESDTLVLTALRHRLAVEKAIFFLSQATGSMICGSYPELIAADIRDALDALGEITGKTADDDILTRIFANFCIGK